MRFRSSVLVMPAAPIDSGTSGRKSSTDTLQWPRPAYRSGRWGREHMERHVANDNDRRLSETALSNPSAPKHTPATLEQQLAIAKVRAVEHDRFVLVAGTTGVSAVIAPDGGEVKRTDFFVPDYLDTQVRLKTNLTPATRWAPILQWVLVGAAGAVILAAIRHNGWFPRPARRRSGPADGESHTPSGGADDADAVSKPKDDLDAENAAASQLKTANDAPSDEGGGTRIGRDEGAT